MRKGMIGLVTGMAAIGACAALLWGLALSVSASGKGNPNPGVLPPQSNPFGMTYGEWSAGWVQWVMSIPADVNPLLDTTGENCAQGQSGKMLFLAGENLPGPVQRTCSIPTGKALCFPIANYWWIRTPGDPEWDEDLYRQTLADAMDGIPLDEVQCEIDGVPVRDMNLYRVQSTVFDAYLPPGNIWEVYGVTEGVYGPSVGDGYYLILAPLSAGQHTIHIQALPFNQDITYELTVVPGKGK